MRFLTSLFGALALAACSLTATAPAMAQTVAPRTNYIPNEHFEGVANLAAPYTNATTTPTVLAGTELVIPATNRDWTQQVFTVCWSADVTKSTSTTGAVGIAVDGVPITASYRYSSSAAGRNGLSSCYSFYRASAAATTISLYGVSQDTASFAVTSAQTMVAMRQFLRF